MEAHRLCGATQGCLRQYGVVLLPWHACAVNVWDTLFFVYCYMDGSSSDDDLKEKAMKPEKKCERIY